MVFFYPSLLARLAFFLNFCPWFLVLGCVWRVGFGFYSLHFSLLFSSFLFPSSLRFLLPIELSRVWLHDQMDILRFRSAVIGVGLFFSSYKPLPRPPGGGGFGGLLSIRWGLAGCT